MFVNIVVRDTILDPYLTTDGYTTDVQLTNHCIFGFCCVMRRDSFNRHKGVYNV